MIPVFFFRAADSQNPSSADVVSAVLALRWGTVPQVGRQCGAGGRAVVNGISVSPGNSTGGSERVGHLLQILLVCIGIVALVRLALRLGLDRTQAAAGGLMVVAIPPILWMASTVMPDIAAFAFGLTGIERLLAWKDDRRWHQGLAAALALGLAPYGRPHMVLLLPLGALWLFDELRIGKALQQFRREAYLWSPLLAAACLLSVVLVVTHDHGPKVESTNFFVGLGRDPAKSLRVPDVSLVPGSVRGSVAGCQLAEKAAAAGTPRRIHSGLSFCFEPIQKYSD